LPHLPWRLPGNGLWWLTHLFLPTLGNRRLIKIAMKDVQLIKRGTKIGLSLLEVKDGPAVILPLFEITIKQDQALR
jgi:hypothetical protein